MTGFGYSYFLIYFIQFYNCKEIYYYYVLFSKQLFVLYIPALDLQAVFWYHLDINDIYSAH